MTLPYLLDIRKAFVGKHHDILKFDIFFVLCNDDQNVLLIHIK